MSINAYPGVLSTIPCYRMYYLEYRASSGYASYGEEVKNDDEITIVVSVIDRPAQIKGLSRQIAYVISRRFFGWVPVINGESLYCIEHNK